ncbi:YceK/YidQ family lipoprotein [Pectobacteriaceae bacterium CE70]|uniref:YceK/YidQ family lipoprotein n=1 Tax=Serratia sp. (strain ATCC 39006) TaxID=104623 RepID=A0A2I5T2U5_SERS3|nr:YceK/YidQ family lipoprotein [Serratia sp. ATCC 39006]WJV62489.1 YceK/YidQ family lipoprotein [Pectobacteriaceae bacterium C52]WJV66802.1 YceK/YidQ family lipoprotein [Pectobacteriaceae bacterium CE70]WJY10796.1 YceK/YidQ family lipoprotein [Pectobacteriaceae bacterium C80]AUG98885.1 YceK/YidQ family lipoprotein [Serratia sp. ATCC 39006]AUH03200.1 YceK/YidQ family lipoprotein [Serratia sp. ATCC 39006]
MTILKSALFSFTLSGSALIVSSGCSSVMTHTGGEQGYYSGTKASVAMLEDKKTNWVMKPLAAIDLPFSAALDTLLLPYDYYRVGDESKSSLRQRIADHEQQNQLASSTIASSTTPTAAAARH